METKTKKRKVGAPKKRTAPKTEKPRTAGTGSRTSRSLPTRRKKPGPEVVYVPPKPFNRNRLLLSLAITLAVVLALTFSISLFFSVEVITVSGAEKYDAWTVKEASGIQYGDSLLSFGKAKAVGKIKMALPYVNTVFFDWKASHSTVMKERIGGDLPLIKSNLARLLRADKNTHVRIPLIPDVNTSEEALDAIAADLREVGVQTVALLPFHRLAVGKYEAMGIPYSYRDTPPLPADTLRRAVEILYKDFTVYTER